MKVNGYACDQCEKFSDTNEDWFVVSKGDSQALAEVCSAGCLAKLGRELVKAEQAEMVQDAKTKILGPSTNGSGSRAGGVTPNDEPCWVCGRHDWDTRQGMFMHMTKAHGYERGMDQKALLAKVTANQAKTHDAGSA